MGYGISQIIVDEAKLKSDDLFSIIEPVWFSVSVIDGEEQYNKGIEAFTPSQKHLFTILCYIAEVNNGGHDQFYFNSAGLVWQDALRGFEVLKIDEGYELLKESVHRMGGSPSKDRFERQEQLLRHVPKFDDLDNSLYQIEGRILESLKAFIRANKEDFLFSGSIKIPK